MSKKFTLSLAGFLWLHLTSFWTIHPESFILLNKRLVLEASYKYLRIEISKVLTQTDHCKVATKAATQRRSWSSHLAMSVF